ncbi:hypothetical protein, partial [Sellimonas intestinalis]|uniref:hypothetical protein n=1 Tax=Sellimonas intestinalis TaxID=1653434 RepID=UPI00266C1FAF
RELVAENRTLILNLCHADRHGVALVGTKNHTPYNQTRHHTYKKDQQEDQHPETFERMAPEF